MFFIPFSVPVWYNKHITIGKGVYMGTEVKGPVTQQEVFKALKELSEHIMKSEDGLQKPEYRFNPEKMKEEELQTECDNIRKELEQKKYKVELYEDIEENDAGSGKKYYIKLIDVNNNYIDIDFFEYKKKILNNEESTKEYIRSCVERLSGMIRKDDDDVVKPIIRYLSHAMYYKEEYIKAYRNLGWSEYNGEDIFKYDIIYSAKRNIKGKCTNEISGALSPNETDLDDKFLARRRWAEQAVRVMNYSAHASLIIAASISGIIRQMITFTKETNINMNIAGDRATGKSTISHFALSLFGNPEFLEGSFIDTENAMEAIRAERGVIPYVMDERMLKAEGSTERTKRKLIMHDIFREYEGRVRERMGKQYEGISGKRTCSPVISSSVESMVGLIYDYGDIGQFRRFIELKIDDEKTLFESASEAERTEDTAYTYYGYGMEVLMDYIFTDELKYKDKLQKRFNIINKAIKIKLAEAEAQNNIKGLQSSSKRFALLIVSYLTLVDALRHFAEIAGITAEDVYGKEGEQNVQPVTKTIKDKSQEITNILINNIVDKMKMVRASINVKKKMDSFIKRHYDLFHTEETVWDGEGDYLGHLTSNENGYTVEMRKNSNVGWLMISPKEFTDEELREYVSICKKNNYGLKNKEMAYKLTELTEDKCDENFMKYIKRFIGGNVRTGERHTKSRRFDQIIVSYEKINESDKDLEDDGE